MHAKTSLLVDALFNSVSAMTVTGLTTINLSGLTGWQQVILYIQMWAGNIVSGYQLHCRSSSWEYAQTKV